MKVAEIDISKYPIVVVNFLPVEVALSDVDEYLDWHMKVVMEAKEKLAMVYNLDGGKYLTGDGRIKLSEWNKKHDKLLMEKLYGKAMVSSSIVQSTLLKIYLALLKNELKPLVFTKMEEAMKWAAKVTKKEVV
jgi:hypothetical protein